MSKRIRRPLGAYSVPGSSWLVTNAALDRARKPFADASLASATLDCFICDCCTRGVVLHLAVLLPDYAHLIVEVTTGNIVDLLRDLKTRTTRIWWEHGGTGALWQKSFHDRGLRSRMAFDKAVSYVLNNPVRAGLTPEWEAYPFVAGEVIGR